MSVLCGGDKLRPLLFKVCNWIPNAGMSVVMDAQCIYNLVC